MSDLSVRIGIVDYGAGNLRSVENALRHLGAYPRVLLEPDDLKDVDGVILPGVGSFGYAASSLARSGFVTALRTVANQKPLLGICLGMQLFFDSSEESPEARGLGIIRGRVMSMPSGPAQKVPNMGWCQVTATRDGLVGAAGSAMSYYFAHSYLCLPADENVVSATVCDPSPGFVAAVETGRIVGVQFHPEKSGPDGLKLLERYLALCKGCRQC